MLQLLCSQSVLQQPHNLVEGCPTEWQEAEPVSGHGELVEAVEPAQLPGNVAQLVVISSQILQRHTTV